MDKRQSDGADDFCNHLLFLVYEAAPVWAFVCLDGWVWHIHDLTVKYNKALYALGGSVSKQPYKPEDFINPKRGLSHLFDYCPKCGVPNNWPRKKQELASHNARDFRKSE